MSEKPGTLETIARHLILAIKPLKQAVSDLDHFQQFMQRLGWRVDDLPPAFANLASAIDDAVQALEDFADEPTFVEVQELLESAKNLYDAIQALDEAPAGVDAGEFLAEIGERLFELLLTDYLQAEFPVAYNSLAALDIIEIINNPPSPTKIAFIRTQFKWPQIPEIIRDPESIPERVYGWGTEQLDFLRMIEHALEFFTALNFPTAIREVAEELALAYTDSEEEPFVDVKEYLRVPFYFIAIAGKQLEATFNLLEYRSDDGGLPGIILEPHIPEEFPLSFQIADDIQLKIRAGSDLKDQFGLIIRPGELTVKYPFKPGTELPSAGLGIAFEFTPEESKLLLGRPDATRVQIQGAAAALDVNHLQGELEVIAGADIRGLAIIISAGEGDSFLRKIIGDEDLQLDIPLGVEWSSTRGVHFKGGGGFEVELPLHVDLAAIIAEGARVQAKIPEAEDIDIRTMIGLNLSGALGPLQFVVQDIGLQVELAFTDGNAGPFDIDVGFKFPSGVGIAVDGAGFKGGGFLGIERENERYVGMLELEFQDQIAIKAIGLLTTRLPDGRDGFSLLIIITAEFTPIQLGFGFTLNGVGGLLGVNRTAVVERLRTGVRDNTLNSILFPTDIVANANRIISDLRQVFPPQENRFIFGPMAKIGWGTPTLITLDLGLMIELPEPIRILILGVLRAVLPDEKTPILELQVNFLGVIDFEKERLSFDASIFDSRLLAFPLSGDMAVRLYWGADPNFLLTVGGFHPAYEPPPMNLPQIRRLTLSLLKGNNPRLTLETYYAVTSNTVQVGAKLELYAAAGKFNVYGFLAFDALFQFNPFYFIAQISAMLALRVGSSSIASISLSFELQGPTPWSARGTAKLKLFWFLTVKVRFSKTFGEERDTTLPDVAVIPLLEEALQANGNWQAQLPPRRQQLVSFKQIEPTDDSVIADPFGILEVNQKIVPLNVTIDKFGNQRPQDGNQFSIEDVAIGPEAKSPANVKEFFAPAQFFEKTDSEKLSSNSFEKYDNGVRLTDSEQLQGDYYSRREVEYEVFYIDSQREQLQLFPWFELILPEFGAFAQWTSQGSIARSPLSFAQTAKSALAPEEVSVRQEGFGIVHTEDLTLFDDGSLAASEAEATQRLRELLRDNPELEESLQVVPEFEVQST